MIMCKEIKEKFAELYSLDVNKYVEKKQGLSYLSWSYAWAEFKKIYPDATYEVKKDAEGRCYFGDENIGYMVYTSVTAGGLTYEMWLPVMDNNNKAMKLESYTYATRNGDKSVEAVSMFDINKAVMRCLVKNLAMFGLGLYIYAGEDLPEDIKEYVCADCGAAVDSAMAARTQKAFNAVLCKDCGLKRSEKK
jgi:DNA-directed RNA polymerase subunit RPC12/RpoP